jgi:DNA polymerase III psi subunit
MSADHPRVVAAAVQVMTARELLVQQVLKAVTVEIQHCRGMLVPAAAAVPAVMAGMVARSMVAPVE